VLRQRVFRATLVLVGLVGLVGLVRCGISGASGTSAGKLRDPSLTFSYNSVTLESTFDQLLTINNRESSPVATWLELTAYGNDGNPLSNVSITTVFGSDRGRLVMPPGTNFDVLIFEGEGSDLVVDVEAVVKEARIINFARVRSVVRVEPLDGAGDAVTVENEFTSLLLRNDNRREVTVRVVLVVWNDPPPKKPEQAERVVEIGGLITVPGGGTATVPIEGEAAEVVAAGGDAAWDFYAYFSR
jgi:hypothetical protein